MAGLGVEITWFHKESSEGRTNLPVTGKEEMNELCWNRAPMWFISQLHIQIKVVQADDIIAEHHLAEIKAGDKGATGETQLEASGKGPSHAGNRLHRLAPRSLRTGPSEGPTSY